MIFLFSFGLSLNFIVMLRCLGIYYRLGFLFQNALKYLPRHMGKKHLSDKAGHSP